MIEAIKLVEDRVRTVKHLGTITGDPNNYWRLQEAEKILSILKAVVVVEEKEEKNAET